MATNHVSYIPNNDGRFVRYSYAPSTPSNRLADIGRIIYNFVRATLQLFNALHQSIATFNNIMAALPSCIRYLIHIILSICFPFYTIYQSYVLLINRIHRIVYPIYRAMTLLGRSIVIFVHLPVRAATFLVNVGNVLLRHVLVVLIFIGIGIGLIVILSDDDQRNYIKLHIQNATEFILKQCSFL